MTYSVFRLRLKTQETLNEFNRTGLKQNIIMGYSSPFYLNPLTKDYQITFAWSFLKSWNSCS